MVGIVIVSHSRKLAEGLADMAREMAINCGEIIAYSGGIDDPDHPLGTDALAVIEAIGTLSHLDGVVIFADIGSSRLNSEMAIEMLDAEQAGKVHLCDAPLVEGVLAAASEASGGSSVEQVIAAAREASLQQGAQQAGGQREQREERKIGPNALSGDFFLRNTLGLHARPAAMLVAELRPFDAYIEIANLNRPGSVANARSINQVITLAAVGGDTVRAKAEGRQAAAALEHIGQMVAKGFNEKLTVAPPTSPTAANRAKQENAAKQENRVKQENRTKVEAGQLKAAAHQTLRRGDTLKGVGISPGIAIGSALWLMPLKNVERRSDCDPAMEKKRFKAAVEKVGKELLALITEQDSKDKRYGKNKGDGKNKRDGKSNGNTLFSPAAVGAEILKTHLMILEDPQLIDTTQAVIEREHINAEAAWQEAVNAMLQLYEQLENRTFKARGEDLSDVGRRVMRALQRDADQVDRTASGREATTDNPIILCMEELGPSDLLALDLQKLAAICTVGGEPTSHSAILASAFDIPVLFDLGFQLRWVEQGKTLVVDGDAAFMIFDPTVQELQASRKKIEMISERRKKMAAYSHRRISTADGHPCRVGVNIASVNDAKRAVAVGADEVGLFRTEFLFIDRHAPPDEEEQYEIYSQIAEILDGRPLTIRSMDIGGDKQVPYLQQGDETNPNLGWRGIRYSLANPQLFQVQLRAILRTAQQFNNLRIMAPLVTTIDEVKQLRDFLRLTWKTVGGQSPYCLPTGVMIETPAAVQLIPHLAPLVDFFSIGVNDLTQYIMAADRNNAATAALVDPFQPPVLQAIHSIIKEAQQKNVAVGMCGGMAGNLLATRLLLGMGLVNFSVPINRVAEIKYSIAQCQQVKAAAIIDTICNSATVEEVRRLCHQL